MKRLQGQGVSSKKRQAEALTSDEKELLWKKGLLGVASPKTMITSLFFV